MICALFISTFLAKIRYLVIVRLARLASSGRIGALAARTLTSQYGLPADSSQSPMLTILLSTLAGLLLVATLLPLLPGQHWLIRGFDFPRLQFFCLSVLGAVLTLFIDHGPTAALLITTFVGCSLYHFWWIYPYLPVSRNQTPSVDTTDESNSIRILSANVLMHNKNSSGLLDLVGKHDPDVVVTLETSQWWENRLDTLLPEYPYACKCALENLYGMHVYSRLALSDVETAFIVEDDKPSMHMTVELRSGKTLRLHALHPAPPSPTENLTSSERDAELIVIAKSLKDEHRPVIVTGDMNDVAWSATTQLFRRISGLLDPRVGRGFYNTFHAGYPLIRWPLDHLFHSKHFRLVHLSCLPSFGSDHFALLSELQLVTQYSEARPPQAATSAERAVAEKKINSEDASVDDVPS